MNTVSRLLLPPFFAVGLSVLAQAASVSPPEITALRVQPSGEFNFDQISVFAGHFAPGWSRTDQGSSALEAGYPKRADARWETMVPAQTELNGVFASVRNGDTFCSVAIVAVDDQPLAESSLLLITHLTDVLPTGVLFDSSDRKIQESVGRLPLLVRRGSSELTLKLEPDGDYRAWAVSSTGARLHEVSLSRTDAGWVLQASTVTPEGTQLAYEIQRNQFQGINVLESFPAP